MNIFTLLAVPFFIYAGDLMVRGGIAQRIVSFAGSLIGHVRGHLASIRAVLDPGGTSQIYHEGYC